MCFVMYKKTKISNIILLNTYQTKKKVNQYIKDTNHTQKKKNKEKVNK